MKGFALLAAVAMLLLWVPSAVAQDYDHGEIGVFADYVRLHHANDANYLGLGGRAGFNISPHVQLEGEVSYDFEKSFTTGTLTNAGTLTVTRTNLRLLHGLFGPKLQTGNGAWRLFVTAKGGFLNFNVSSSSVVSGVGSAFSGVPNGDTNGVFYPGGGIEAFAGPVGLRVDIGDLMYFDRGANHNLRITFGPQLRF